MGVTSAALSAGLNIGLAVAVPVGPMGILCLQNTLTGGFRAGAVTGLGAATTQVVWGALAILGLQTWLLVWTSQNAKFSALLTAALLAWFAYRILRRRTAPLARQALSRQDLGRCFACALTLGLTSPLTLLLVAAAASSMIPTEIYLDVRQVLLGQFCGALAWWLVFSCVVAFMRVRISCNVVRWINIISGGCLLFLAIRKLASVFLA